MINITSEIAGKVWSIDAKVGDKLKKNATIITLESMKMEIPVVAPVAGTVQKLHIAEGDMIEEGQEIATMEADA